MKEREIDMYGVVLSFSVPKLTKRKEWMMQVTLTDDSINFRANGNNGNDTSRNENHTGPQSITINIFRQSIDLLPKLKRAGDILRGHRLLPEVC